MESYKDVIVSQPPAMYSQLGFATQFSVENYKGILLCERPPNLGSATGEVNSSANVSSAPFVPSNPTGNPVGYAPSKESRALNAEHIARRVLNQKQQQLKTCQALSRHRRWLRSFAKQMKSMKESERQCEVEAARRAARRRKSEQQKIAEQQQLQQQQAEAMTSSQPAVLAPYNMHKEMEDHVAATRKAVAPAARKPKWAMTEEEAIADELDIDRDLLDFAEHLDYEKFISDFEVAEALGVMRDRVVQIAKANDWSVEDIRRGNDGAEDEDDLDSMVTPSEAQVLHLQQRAPQPGGATAAGARPAAPGSQATHAHDWDSSIGRGRLLKKAISRDAVALAERLFAASPSLQKIHTKHSLARVLQRCALEGNVDVTEATLLQAGGKRPALGASASPPPTAGAAIAKEPEALPEPLVVQVSADALPASAMADGAIGMPSPPRILRELQQSKERTQGLPYLYRCPAI
ncbi:hypothetical protein ABL78_7194 [Leptomonas seymouri]|uniref:Uncharacterized protein n=1 Tax=Leptomonas seymouri TaxID=5684 RepID=A0A0N0P362_LEPSE|nr:hypothetical protein ABL78_7194 [Leptomonas seymouri]|eukprot:KPI83759.1 hypothetical protein ABL78_7194 [Leptomonas seymouri]